MKVEFISAKRLDDHTVAVIYTANGEEFTVEWSNIHPQSGEVAAYDLQLEVKSSNEDLANSIKEAIQEGESDENAHLGVYLTIRDTFGSGDCEELESDKVDSQMKIINTELLNLGDEGAGQATVRVKAQSAAGDVVAFYVQTNDNEYRSDLGGWITTDDSNGDISDGDYPDFDIELIIKAAEDFISKAITYTPTDYFINHQRAYLVERPFHDEIAIVTENPNFINKHTSSYQSPYSDLIGSFESKEEAIEYLKAL